MVSQRVQQGRSTPWEPLPCLLKSFEPLRLEQESGTDSTVFKILKNVVPTGVH
jgi:hypothetical protein